MKYSNIPLNPLRAYEAAARLCSFTKAAQELHVSQVAISRQIKVLEDYLGVALFMRESHGVRLTASGSKFYPMIASAFNSIAQAELSIINRRRSDVISIQAYTTFAQYRLIPLLSSFYKAHPRIEVRLSASTQPVDFLNQDLDVAIRSGSGNWPGVESDFLTPIELVPVMSPKLFQELQHNGRINVDTLKSIPLLHSLARPYDWASWLEAQGEDSDHYARTLKFENSAMAYEAALQGIGCAIGIRVLVERYLTLGLLVAPFRQSCILDDGYYLLRPKGREISDSLAKFREWLLQSL